MRKSFKKAISFVLALTMIMSMVCITNIAASAESKQCRLGDVNMDGKINVNDATLIQRYSAELITLTDDQLYLANVNGDKKVNVNDATYIQRYAAELLSSYAVNADGYKLGDVVTIGDETIPTATTEKTTETVVPTTKAETVPGVDYSKYSLVGYINGADTGCEGDSDNVPNVFAKDGTQTLTFTDTSYVFVKTTDNKNWYMFDEYCAATTGTLKLSVFGDENAPAEKMMVPAGKVTFKLVENVDGTLTLSYVAEEAPTSATTAPSTEEVTEETTPAVDYSKYSLVGYINGADTGCEGDSDNVPNVFAKDGTQTLTFTDTSYVFVKTTDNKNWYMFDEYCAATTGTLKLSIFGDENAPAEKMMVPAGKVTFTLVENADGTLTLSYVAEEAPTSATTAPSTEKTTEKETTPAVDYSKYSLVGYINGADTGCEADSDNVPNVFAKNGTQTLTFTDTSYVFVKTTDNKNWYMFDKYCEATTGTLKLSVFGDENAPAEKMMVPAGKVTFTLVENADGTLTLSYVAEEAPTSATTAPSTEKDTEAATTAPSTEKETEGKTVTYKYYFAPQAADVEAGYTFVANIENSDGKWFPYAMEATGETYKGAPVYVATIEVPETAKVATLQYQVYDGEKWQHQIEKKALVEYSTYADKVMVAKSASEGELSDYVADAATTAPSTEKETTPGVDYSKYSLVGYINGADTGCEGDSDNVPNVFAKNGTQTLTFTDTSYVFVKTTDNKNWYMFDEYCAATTGTLKLSVFGDENAPAEKMMVPAGKVTFTLVENADGTLTLSYVAEEAPTSATTAPSTEKTTEAATTAPATEGKTVYSIHLGVEGQGDSWKTNPMTAVDKDTTKLTLNLKAGTYSFKVTDGTNWLGNNGTIVDTTVTTSENGWDMEADRNDCKLEATGGTYEFIYTISTSKLVVKHTPAETEKSTEAATTAPSTEKETTPAVDYSKYSLVGYINGADTGCEGDSDNVPNVFAKNGTQTLTFTDTSYVFVKTTDNKNWYMFDKYCEATTGTLKLSVFGDENAPAEKMMVPAGKVTFTLVENADGTLTLSYVAEEAPTSATTAPSTEKDTEAATTAPSTEKETEGKTVTYKYYFAPQAADVKAGYKFVANIENSDGKWSPYAMEATGETYKGAPVYVATIEVPETAKVATLQYQVYDGEKWQHQIEKKALVEYSTYADKVMVAKSASEGELSDYVADVATTAPSTEKSTEAATTAPTTEKTTEKTTEAATTAPATEGKTVYSIHLGVEGQGDSWKTNPMTAVDKDTIKLTLNLKAGTYSFKVTDGTNWLGNNGTIVDTTVTTSENGWDMEADRNDCKLEATGGTYEFIYTISTSKLVVKHTPAETEKTTEAATTAPVTTAPATTAPATTAPSTEKETEGKTVYSIHLGVEGQGDSWKTNPMTAVDKDTTKLTLNLKAGTYSFKVTDGTNWLGNNGTIVDTTVTTSENGWDMEADRNDCKLQATGGTYEFIYTISTSKLVVKHTPAETEKTTEAATTAPATTAPATEGKTVTYKYYFAPQAADVKAGYKFVANIENSDGKWFPYAMEATGETYKGAPVYVATIEVPETAKVATLQYQVYNGEKWQHQIEKKALVEYSTYADKVMVAKSASEGELSDYVADVATTAPSTEKSTEAATTAPTTEKTTEKTTEAATTAPATEGKTVYSIHLGVEGQGDSWKTNPMTAVDKDTTKLTLNLKAGTYSFKVTDGTNWLGNNGTIVDTTVTTSENGWDMEADRNDCKLEATGGTYEFIYTISTSKLVVKHTPAETEKTTEAATTAPVTTAPATTAPATTAPSTEKETEGKTVYSIHLGVEGQGDSWKTNPMTAVDKDTTKLTLNLKAGTYSFKVTDGTNWLGNNGTIVDTTVTTSENGWDMEADRNDCKLEATGGTYEFIYTISTSKLVIKFTPAATEKPTEPTPVKTIKVKVVDNAGWLSNGGAKLFLYDNATGKHYDVDASGVATIPVDATDLTLYRCNGSWNSGKEDRTDKGITTYWNKFTPAKRTEGQNLLTVNSEQDSSWSEEKSGSSETGKPSTYKVAGSFNNWGSSTDYLCYTETENVVTVTLELAKGQHKFKIANGDTWYGNNGEFTDSATGWTMSTSENDCTINATGGKYTFTLNTSTNKLTVAKA